MESNIKNLLEIIRPLKENPDLITYFNDIPVGKLVIIIKPEGQEIFIESENSKGEVIRRRVGIPVIY